MPQHEPDGEDLGPGGLPLLQQDGEEEGGGGQDQLVGALEGGADVQQAPVAAAVQKRLVEDAVPHVAHRVAWGKKWERKKGTSSVKPVCVLRVILS